MLFKPLLQPSEGLVGRGGKTVSKLINHCKMKQCKACTRLMMP